jgi:hypothetical protein
MALLSLLSLSRLSDKRDMRHEDYFRFTHAPLLILYECERHSYKINRGRYWAKKERGSATSTPWSARRSISSLGVQS